MIFGQGNQLSTLQSLSEKLGIEDRVYFMGFIDYPFRYSKYADLFVLSSIYEGYPNVLVVSWYVCSGLDCDFGPREILVGVKDRLFIGDQRNLTRKWINILVSNSRRYDCQARIHLQNIWQC